MMIYIEGIEFDILVEFMPSLNYIMRLACCTGNQSQTGLLIKTPIKHACMPHGPIKRFIEIKAWDVWAYVGVRRGGVIYILWKQIWFWNVSHRLLLRIQKLGEDFSSWEIYIEMRWLLATAWIMEWSWMSCWRLESVWIVDGTATYSITLIHGILSFTNMTSERVRSL